MKVYAYQDQSGTQFITWDEIMEEYYPWWMNQMRKVGKEHEISPEACVEDFCTTQWATEVFEL